MADKKMTQEDKELKLVNLRKDLANAEKEIKNISETIDDSERRRKWVRDFQEAKEIMHKAAMNCPEGFKMLEPKYQFQTTPEYEAAQRLVSDQEYVKSLFEFEETIAKIESNLKSKREQIESQVKHSESLRAQIAELEAN